MFFLVCTKMLFYSQKNSFFSLKKLNFTYNKSLENKTTRNIVNASYLFTQLSTLAMTYTTTAREPSIYTRQRHENRLYMLGIVTVERISSYKLVNARA